MKPNWNEAPEGAEFYANHRFRKSCNIYGVENMRWSPSKSKWLPSSRSTLECKVYPDYCERPKDIDNLNIDKVMSMIEIQGDDDAIELEAKAREMVQCVADDKSSIAYLKRCIDVQADRASEYDPNGHGERSFAAAAEAFNALTGESLEGSDVCLLLVCLKAVRQNSDKNRVHDDSLLDMVSYASLWAELLNAEVGDD